MKKFIIAHIFIYFHFISLFHVCVFVYVITIFLSLSLSLWLIKYNKRSFKVHFSFFYYAYAYKILPQKDNSVKIFVSLYICICFDRIIIGFLAAICHIRALLNTTHHKLRNAQLKIKMRVIEANFALTRILLSIDPARRDAPFVWFSVDDVITRS